MCSTPWSSLHLRQCRPALEGAKGRAHGRPRVLRRLGPVGRVPRVVGGDVTGEQVPEMLLVALGHPQVQGAGIQVGAQTTGGGRPAGGGGSDRGRGCRPRDPTTGDRGVGDPLGVQEGLDAGPSAGAGGPPSGRWTSRSGRSRACSSRCRGAEEVVGRARVRLEERVAVDVVHGVAVPLLGLGTVEVTADQAHPRRFSRASWSAETVPAAMSA